MIKKIIPLGFVIVSSIAFANNFYATASLKGPNGSLIRSINSLIPENKFVAKQSGGCGEAVANFEGSTTPSAIVWSNSMYRNSRKSKQNCVIDYEKAKPVMVTRVPYEVCVRSDYTLPYTTSKPLSFGTNKFVPNQDHLKELNTNVKGLKFYNVIHKGSGHVLSSLINGDIDVGFIARNSAQKAMDKGSIKCLYSSGENRQNGQQPLSSLVPNTGLATFNLGMMVWVNNMSDNDVEQLVAKLKPLEKELTKQSNVDIAMNSYQ